MNYDPCFGIDCSGNGDCINGDCDCYPGYFGSACSESCSTVTCLNGGRCDEVTGQCNCNGSYEGPDCSQRKDGHKKNTTIIIASSSAGGALLLLLLIFAGIAVAIRSRRRQIQSFTAPRTQPAPTDSKVSLLSAM